MDVKRKLDLQTNQLTKAQRANVHLTCDRDGLILELRDQKLKDLELEETLHSLELDKRDADERSANFEASLKRLRVRNAHLHEQLNEQRHEIVRLNTSMDSANEYKGRLIASQDLVRRYTEFDSRNFSQEPRGNELEELNTALTNENKELRMKCQRMTNAGSAQQLAELKSVVREQRREIEALRRELAEAKRRHPIGDAASSELTPELREQITTAQQKLENVQITGEEISREIADTKRAVAVLLDVITADTPDTSSVEDWNGDE
jgi:predicted RNase H-like nuclease (RuvC/YqgF family)